MSDEYTFTVDGVDEDNLERYGFDSVDVGGDYIYAEMSGSKGGFEVDGYDGVVEVFTYGDVDIGEFEVEAIKQVLAGGDVPVDFTQLVDDDIVPDAWETFESRFDDIAESEYSPTCMPSDGHGT